MERKYSAQIEELSPKRISETKILVGGAGATGSAVIINAVRTGISVIKVIDDDILEEHNLENQVYTADDFGLPKVKAIEQLARRIDPEVKIIPIQKKIQNATFNELKADVYLSCFDNFGARFYLNSQSIFRNTPMIDVGIQSFDITLRTVIPRKTPCLECLPDLIPNVDIRAACSKEKIPSMFSTAQIAAGLQIIEFLKLIHGWSISPYQYFNLKTGRFGKISLERDMCCKLCGVRI